MPDTKQKPAASKTGPLKCDLLPKEALKRAMLVPVPEHWKEKRKSALKV